MSAPAGALFDLTGKVAVVTGGSRGLGREICLAFAVQGATVIVASRKIESCQDVADEIVSNGGSAHPIACHVGVWDRCEELVRNSYDLCGCVDILVNNAGLSPLYPSLAELGEDLYDRVLGQSQRPVSPWSSLRRPDGQRDRWLDHQHQQHLGRPARTVRTAVRNGQGRYAHTHHRPLTRLRPRGPGERQGLLQG